MAASVRIDGIVLDLDSVSAETMPGAWAKVVISI